MKTSKQSLIVHLDETEREQWGVWFTKSTLFLQRSRRKTCESLRRKFPLFAQADFSLFDSLSILMAKCAVIDGFTLTRWTENRPRRTRNVALCELPSPVVVSSFLPSIYWLYLALLSILLPSRFLSLSVPCVSLFVSDSPFVLSIPRILASSFLLAIFESFFHSLSRYCHSVTGASDQRKRSSRKQTHENNTTTPATIK